MATGQPSNMGTQQPVKSTRPSMVMPPDDSRGGGGGGGGLDVFALDARRRLPPPSAMEGPWGRNFELGPAAAETREATAPPPRWRVPLEASFTEKSEAVERKLRAPRWETREGEKVANEAPPARGSVSKPPSAEAATAAAHGSKQRW